MANVHQLCHLCHVYPFIDSCVTGYPINLSRITHGYPGTIVLREVLGWLVIHVHITIIYSFAGRLEIVGWCILLSLLL